MSYYFGIDVGTSSSKVILIDQDKNVIDSCSVEYSVDMPKKGWKEINPEVWFDATIKCMKQILSNVDETVRKNVSGIGTTGQMHTIIFLDEKGESIRPALMWNDTRTKDLVPELKEKVAKYENIAHINNILSTGSPASNLYWLKNNEPESYKKIKKILIGPDYIVYRLTGNYSTDYCDASTSSLYNLYEDTWSEEMREILELNKEVYPTIKGSKEIAGTLRKEIADELNLSTDVKVLVGTGDNPAAALATGVMSHRNPVLSLGTSGVLVATRDSVDFNRKGKNIRFSLDGKEVVTLVQGAVQSVGSSLNWWMRSILNEKDFEKDIHCLDVNSLSASNIIFYPHLNGDKTVFADPSLRGAFIGLGTDTTRSDMEIAVMEGISYGFRQLIEAMQVDLQTIPALKVTGGGSKSKYWMQILANVLHINTEQLSGNTGAGFGMAVLAASVDYPDMDILSSSTNAQNECFVPRNTETYDAQYVKYKKIYNALKSIEE